MTAFEGRAYGERVLIEDPPHVDVTASGLVLVGGDKLDVVCAKVLSIGSRVKDKTLKVGDRVLCTRVTGVKWSGGSAGMPRGNYRFVREDELFEILPPDAKFGGGTGFFNEAGEHVTARS